MKKSVVVLITIVILSVIVVAYCAGHRETYTAHYFMPDRISDEVIYVKAWDIEAAWKKARELTPHGASLRDVQEGTWPQYPSVLTQEGTSNKRTVRDN